MSRSNQLRVKSHALRLLDRLLAELKARPIIVPDRREDDAGASAPPSRKR